MTLPDAARVESSVPPSNDGQHRCDVVGELAGLEPVEQLPCGSGFASAQASNATCHSACCGGAALARLAGVLEDVLRDDEGLLGVEAEHLLGRGQLGGAEGGAVDLAGVLLARARASR